MNVMCSDLDELLELLELFCFSSKFLSFLDQFQISDSAPGGRSDVEAGMTSLKAVLLSQKLRDMGQLLRLCDKVLPC